MNNKEAGFSLLELIISTFMMAVIITTVFLMWKLVTESFSTGSEQVQQVDEVTRSVRQMVNELRVMRDGEDGSYPLTTTNDNEVVFYSDVDNDRQAERVHYFIQGNSLMRGLVEPTGDPPTYVLTGETVRLITNKLVTNGQLPLLRYFNKDFPGDLVNNPLILTQRLLNTRSMQVQVTVSVTEDFAVQDLSWSSMVELRNMGRLE